MDFRNILSSLSSLAEGETKETEKGRVHKGTYGSEYETDREGNEKKKEKPEAEKKGRGRPKKDGGDEKKFDTKGLQDFMTGGKKPKKDIGKVSKKHSLKEYFDEVSANKQLDEMMPQQPIPVVGKEGGTQQTGAGFLNITDNSPASQAIEKALGDLAKQKKAQIVVPTSPQQQKPIGTTNAPQSTGTAQGVSVEEEALDQPATMEGEMDESALQAYLGNKKYGKEGMDALRKAGRDHASKEKMASIRAKYDKMDEAEGPMLNGPAGGLGAGRDPKVLEKKDMPGNQERLDVAPPKGKLTAADFAALRAKKKVKEGRDQDSSEYLDEKVAKILAREKPGMSTVKSNDKFYSAVYHELIACGLTPKAARHKVSYDEDFISDVASAYSHYQKNPSLDEETFKPTPVRPENIPAVARKSMGAEPLRLGDVMRPDPSSISSLDNLRMRAKGQEPKPMGLTMKDVKFESWDKQLNNLLNEGITVSSSTGQQGSPDSVTVSATDSDADQLLQVLRQAGVGVFGGGEQEHSGYGAPVSDVEPEGHGQEPEVAPEVVGDGDDMLALIKKMTGIEAGPEGTAEVDYEEEEDADTGTEGPDSEATKADEKSDEGDSGSDEESKDSRGDSKEEVDEAEMEEGNLFTGNLAKARAAGKEEADLDGDGDMEKVHEGEENCMECGMYESQCECDHEQMNEFANDAGGDGTAEAELAKLKMLLSMGNDLNKPKRDQTVLNPTQVNVAEALNDWKKLSGIK